MSPEKQKKKKLYDFFENETKRKEVKEWEVNMGIEGILSDFFMSSYSQGDIVYWGFMAQRMI